MTFEEFANEELREQMRERVAGVNVDSLLSIMKATWDAARDTGVPPSVQWQDEPPSEAGWYYLDDGQAEPRVVEVRRWPIEDAEIQFTVEDPHDSDDVLSVVKDYDDPRWAGPIPEPTE